MKMYKTKIVGLIVLSLFSFIFMFSNPGDVYGKIYPNEGYRHWNWDEDQNRIDDRLEAMNPEDTVDAVVLFNHCLTQDDVNFTTNTTAIIKYVGQYVQGIWLQNAKVSELLELLSTQYGEKNIFRIEYCTTVYASLDTSCRAVKARQSGTYTPNTAWDQGFTGIGTVIAVLDTGVDDGHPAFSGKYVAGYNAITQTAVNPDDDNFPVFHGTHVAGTALGIDPTGTYSGVASGAKLVDVKVLNGNGSGTFSDFQAGLGWCIANRQTYNIKVINISLGDGVTCNGQCANCMAVDVAVSADLVVCVAAGNDYAIGWMPSPAAADRAITVGAVDDNGTVSRNDETHAAFSNSGPRLSDGDNNLIEENKPDVVAPGVSIYAPMGVNPGQNPGNIYHDLNGTSMAAPHVAGVAAILLSCKPGLSPGAVKAILRNTSRDSAQNVNPAYTPDWGKGEVDAYQATSSTAAADLYINSWIQDIYTPTIPPQSGVQTNLNARVYNIGPNAANGVKVLFYTNKNNLGYGQGWVQIGETTVSVPSAGMTVATVPWTPIAGHQCIRAEAVYSGDPILGNNMGQENFDPAPSKFFVEVGSPYTGDRSFLLKVDPSGLLINEGWTARIYPEEDGLFEPKDITTHDPIEIFFDLNNVELDRPSDCCPRIVFVDINHPDNAPVGQYSEVVLEGWDLDAGEMVGRQVFHSYVPQTALSASNWELYERNR